MSTDTCLLGTSLCLRNVPSGVLLHGDSRMDLIRAMGAATKLTFDVYPKSRRAVVMHVNENEWWPTVGDCPPNVTQHQGLFLFSLSQHFGAPTRLMRCWFTQLSVYTWPFVVGCMDNPNVPALWKRKKYVAPMGLGIS